MKMHSLLLGSQIQALLASRNNTITQVTTTEMPKLIISKGLKYQKLLSKLITSILGRPRLFHSIPVKVTQDNVDIVASYLQELFDKSVDGILN